MHLDRARRQNIPADPSTIVGVRVTARPQTASRSITGTVIEVDGYAVVLQTPNMIVAVDIEDCDLPLGRPPSADIGLARDRRMD